MYLMIENTGEAPVEAFTVFGASTARGNEDAIGQFGSGAKFGILACMRANLSPVIYCGRDKLTFFTEPMSMQNQSFRRVIYQHNTKREKTSFTLEFGELDWVRTDMGLREFVSNAIDGAAGDIKGVKVEIVDKPRAKADSTRIFVELTSEVQAFYNNIAQYFLHFSPVKYSIGLISKDDDSGAKVYRKGVFVRQVEGKSLFNYNFGNEFAIDESRNSSDFNVRWCAAQQLSKVTDENLQRKTWQAIGDGKDVMEASFSFGLHLNPTWKTSFFKTFGDNAVICKEASIFAQQAVEKGYRPIVLKDGDWYDKAAKLGIPIIYDVLGNVNSKGHIISDASQKCIDTAKRVWGWIEALDMTSGKSIPAVKEYTEPMDGGSQIKGYYLDNVVYIEKGSVGSTQTMLEELAHYVTGSTDNSRDFQDYAFKLVSLMGELMG